MNGAESVVRTLLASGIRTCFADPGTREMYIAAALDRVGGMTCVPGLEGNVVVGMADGYFRLAGMPACTLLGGGPSLANGLGNLRGARRARCGIVNLVADEVVQDRPLDLPLAADTEPFARAGADGVRTSPNAASAGGDAAAAVQAARMPPGHVSMLLLPRGVCAAEGGSVAEALAVPPLAAPNAAAIDHFARMLRDSRNALLLLGGPALSARGQHAAWRIAAKTGVRPMAECFSARMARGRGLPPIDRVPYPLELAAETLWGIERLTVVGAKAPVGFPAYPGQPSSHFPAQSSVHVLTGTGGDAETALEAVADALGCPPVPVPEGPLPKPGEGAPSSVGLARTIAALMPEGAILSYESLSLGGDFQTPTRAARPHEWLEVSGGASSGGLSVATGAAIGAGGNRRVISLQADGSATYSVHSLWTRARERLPVTTILIVDRKHRAGVGKLTSIGRLPGLATIKLFDTGNPEIDWVRLAEGLGVEAARAETLERCADLLAASFSRPSPFFIELVM